MRTTAAATSAAITSAPPLLPRPNAASDTSSNTQIEGDSAHQSSNHGNINPVHDSSVIPPLLPSQDASNTKKASPPAPPMVMQMINNSLGPVISSNSSMLPPSVGQFCNSTMFGQKSAELSERNRQLAEDLAEFVERVVQGLNASQRGEGGAPCENEANLQLQTARMIRQVSPYYHVVFLIAHVTYAIKFSVLLFFRSYTTASTKKPT